MKSFFKSTLRDCAVETASATGAEHGESIAPQKEIDEGFLALYSQPIVRTSSPEDKSLRAEMLIVMIDGDREVVSAAQFLRSAQKKGFSEFIDRFVVSEVVDLLVERSNAGFEPMAICNVNLCGSSLSNSLFEKFLSKEISRLDQPGQLCFEITETERITDLPAAGRRMNRLKKAGCRFALDDFGTGFSSFEYLRHLPVDYLKIDGQFIRETPRRSIEYEMVCALDMLARKLGIPTIAEFVESDDVFATVREIGIDFCQGFLFGRPTPVRPLT